jgi:hypothetical protein
MTPTPKATGSNPAGHTINPVIDKVTGFLLVMKGSRFTFRI